MNMAGCGLVRYGWAVGRIAGWTTATAASAVLAWAALQPVLDAAVPERFTPLTGAELRAEAAVVAPSPGRLTSTPPEPEESPEAVPGEEQETTPGSSDDEPDVSEPTEPAGGSDGADGEPEPSEPPPNEPEATEDGWTIVESADGTSYVQTFETDGGVATIEVEPGQATLISATPVEPYAVDTYHEDPERLVVQFYVTDHMWVVDAMWWENGPYGTVTEVP